MLKKNIVIASMNDGLCMATIEDGRVAEIKYEKNHVNQVSVGDIYVGRVKNVVPSLNAAFINVSKDLTCYYEVSKKMKPVFTHKIGEKPICEAEELVVQIEKEAIKTKAPLVSSNLNFTGNYVVLTSENTKLSVSNKIKGEDRTRLHNLLEQYSGQDYGIIARTNSKNASEVDIRIEIEKLAEEYHGILAKAKTRPCYTCLYKSTPSYISYIRDAYTENLEEILVDSQDIYEELLAYVNVKSPELKDKIKLYQDTSYELYKLYSLEARLKEALGKKVWMKSGAYLVIEPTEALTVIDVNSGKCVTKKDKEEQYFKVNLEAAIETAHQLRLRNISGIVIIDFINLKDEEKMQEVLKVLKIHLQNDPIPTKLIGVTKLQLVEITRKKVQKSLQESWRESHE